MGYHNDSRSLAILFFLWHKVYDAEEWVFVPNESDQWLQDIRGNLNKIREYNAKVDTIYHRLLFNLDPDSEASRDPHFISAFANQPLKWWSAEPGVVFMRPLPARPCQPTAELRQIWLQFLTIKEVWLDCESPCAVPGCVVCQGDGIEDSGKGDNSSGEDPENDHQDEPTNDGKGRNRTDDGVGDYQEEDIGPSDNQKRQRTTSGKNKLIKKTNLPLQTLTTNMSRHTDPRSTKPDSKGHMMATGLYDEVIPYSQRVGYTWAGTTSNQLMKMWQANGTPVGGRASSLHGTDENVLPDPAVRASSAISGDRFGMREIAAYKWLQLQVTHRSAAITLVLSLACELSLYLHKRNLYRLKFSVQSVLPRFSQFLCNLICFSFTSKTPTQILFGFETRGSLNF